RCGSVCWVTVHPDIHSRYAMHQACTIEIGSSPRRLRPSEADARSDCQGIACGRFASSVGNPSLSSAITRGMLGPSVGPFFCVAKGSVCGAHHPAHRLFAQPDPGSRWSTSSLSPAQKVKRSRRLPPMLVAVDSFG